MGQELSADEKMTLKTAAFGAVFLVTNADPGLRAMVKESYAASGVIAGTTGVVRDALTTGGLPQVSGDSLAELEAAVLPALEKSVALLADRAPHELANFRTAVIGTAERAAAAVAGISPAEAEMLARIRIALGVPG
ncbi:hypothetical protein [Polymorphospora rubra]|uniref:Uncharacterized protein n=1 Tax=Polymorphospora rubra TaxID=338584 RepID=A0A810MZW7_9ACTN|nr:hypothetical protein [Polymorphospora rubra]BCJ66851.1 hypothetical protein Prubr_38720 [Polymorphospora rubra]